MNVSIISMTYLIYFGMGNNFEVVRVDRHSFIHAERAEVDKFGAVRILTQPLERLQRISSI